MKKLKKKITKANNGLQIVDKHKDILANQDQTHNTINSVVATGGNLIAPGLGTAISTVSSMTNKLTKDENGLYKSKSAAALGGLDPIERVKRIGQGWGKVFKGDFKDAANTFVFGDQSKLKNALDEKQASINNAEFNDRIDNIDPTTMQKKQFKNGAKKINTKVIEIEGKTTPEIHTDEDFNVKNLGTTPHSKGGDKVLAEDGDVVFPTQNSKKKYNEVMTAINNKDVKKLKKIQSKLPEDNSSKYDDGTKKVKSSQRFLSTASRTMAREEDEAIEAEMRNILKRGIDPLKSTPLEKKNYEYAKKTLGNREAFNSINKIKPDTAKPTSTKVPFPFSTGVVTNKPLAAPITKTTPKVNVVSKPKVKTNSTKTVESKPARLPEVESMPPKYNTLLPKLELPKTDIGKLSKASNLTPDELEPRVKGKTSLDANSALELIPTAYNLGQGLFGKAEKVERRMFNPELDKYQDLSDPLRRRSNSMYAQDKSNARNVSGGVAGNSRSNQQAASNSEFDRQLDINTREVARNTDVNMANTRTKNHAKLVNTQLSNQYDEQDAMNRAKKTEALSRGLTDLGKIGTRNIMAKNEQAAYDTMAGALSKGSNYKITKDGIEFDELSKGVKKVKTKYKKK